MIRTDRLTCSTAVKADGSHRPSFAIDVVQDPNLRLQIGSIGKLFVGRGREYDLGFQICDSRDRRLIAVEYTVDRTLRGSRAFWVSVQFCNR